jgi:hypothetical protein
VQARRPRAFFEEFWDDRLAALKVAAEAEQRRKKAGR